MKGDRVEVVVDTGGAVQTFDIVASRAGRRIEVTTARGVVEVTEVTRGGTPGENGGPARSPPGERCSGAEPPG